MTQTSPLASYQRVATDGLEQRIASTGAASSPAAAARVRAAIIPLSALLCLVQAVATVLASNIREMELTCTLIPVLGFVLIFVLVIAVNPLLRLAAALLGQWAAPLNRVELVCLFTAMLVTAGISSFGMAAPLVPMLATPHNPEWNTPARGWNESLLPSLNAKLYIQDPAAIRMFRIGLELTDAQGRRVIAPRRDAPWSQEINYAWNVCKAIPWMVWATPLFYWLIFIVACYGIFYSLTYIVLSYWKEREKLIFPLARLFESIMPEPGGGRYRIPVILRSAGFWCGFAISFLILAWNATVADAWLKDLGLPTFPLGMGYMSVDYALAGTIFQGLSSIDSAQHLSLMIIFVAIGLAFLLPLDVSFSVWFYYLAGRFIVLLYVWSGVQTFPTGFMGSTNPTTAMGGGGILVFSTICLFRCIRDYGGQIAGKSIGRSLMIGLPVGGLFVCSTVALAWLTWNRLPLGWAVVFVACFILLTIGLMRIVAETGIYWFTAETGFFHIYTMLGLGKFLAPVLMAPLLPIYWVIFGDLKTFIAPNMLNAAEMQRNSRASRWVFHLNLGVCIGVSLVVSLVFSIFLAHMRGGRSMDMWYYNIIPQARFDAVQRAITTLPAFDLSHTLWYGAGALWVILTLLMRTTFFWFPHPIGFIMLINPLTANLWFSFFVGWLCKKAVVTFGGKATFDRVRGVFIGLIAGELAAVFFWTTVSLLGSMDITTITLNRWIF